VHGRRVRRHGVVVERCGRRRASELRRLWRLRWRGHAGGSGGRLGEAKHASHLRGKEQQITQRGIVTTHTSPLYM
jgi:hypothetical protein